MASSWPGSQSMITALRPAGTAILAVPAAEGPTCGVTTLGAAAPASAGHAARPAALAAARRNPRLVCTSQASPEGSSAVVFVIGMGGADGSLSVLVLPVDGA